MDLNYYSQVTQEKRKRYSCIIKEMIQRRGDRGMIVQIIKSRKICMLLVNVIALILKCIQISLIKREKKEC